MISRVLRSEEEKWQRFYKALLIEVIGSKEASAGWKAVRRETDSWSSVLSSGAPDELVW